MRSPSPVLNQSCIPKAQNSFRSKRATAISMSSATEYHGLAATSRLDLTTGPFLWHHLFVPTGMNHRQGRRGGCSSPGPPLRLEMPITIATASKKPLGRKAYGSIPHLPGSRIGPGDHHCHEGQRRIGLEGDQELSPVFGYSEESQDSWGMVGAGAWYPLFAPSNILATGRLIQSRARYDASNVMGNLIS